MANRNTFSLKRYWNIWQEYSEICNYIHWKDKSISLKILSIVIYLFYTELTHWGRVTHICVSEIMIIGSDNGLSPGRRQAIIWTNAIILLIGPLGINFSEILIEINTFSFNKMHLKMLFAKWRLFRLGLNVLRLLCPTTCYRINCLVSACVLAIYPTSISHSNLAKSRPHQPNIVHGFILQFYTEHGSYTAVLCAKFQMILWYGIGFIEERDL